MVTMTMYDTELAPPTSCLSQAVRTDGMFPQNLTAWVEPARLLDAVRTAAERACGCSWFQLLESPGTSSEPDALLVLLGYCYLQGIYQSIDILRHLDADDTLQGMRPLLALRPEQVRRFRRDHRSPLTDCLSHALLELWRGQHPTHPDSVFSDSLLQSRMNPRFLEPFYIQARERLDRAVILDSMALDY